MRRSRLPVRVQHRTVNAMQNSAPSTQAYLPPGLTLTSCNRRSLERQVRTSSTRFIDFEATEPHLRNIETSIRARIPTVVTADTEHWPTLTAIARRVRGTVSAIDATHGFDVDVNVNSSTVKGILPYGWDGQHLTGPFDIVGDVHGQFDALVELLEELGYDEQLIHPDGRLAVFVGDLVDKGPQPVRVFDYVTDAVRGGRAICVRGNHENNLLRVLTAAGDTDIRQSLHTAATNLKPARRTTIKQIADVGDVDTWVADAKTSIRNMPTHLMLDAGNLAVVHAAAKTSMLGCEPESTQARNEQQNWFMYGPPRGARTHIDRSAWVHDYNGDTVVVHGHTSEQSAAITGNVVSIDTGAGDGNTLSAYSWPERHVTTVNV